MTVLEIKNLTKRFDGVHAVDHLSLSIPRGLITGIIGPNGSGKTTLINLLSGMAPMDGGAVKINGATLTAIKSHDVSSYGMTRTFQDVRLFEQMTVLDNILVVLTERDVFASLVETHGEYHLKKAEEVLRQTGLWEKKYELAINLSYGQRKLLGIARALAMRAELYLFDEPFAGLFPEMAAIVAGIMKTLREEERTVILIEHNMNIIRELSDYVIVLDSGRLLAEGKPDVVLRRREVIEAYLGE